MTSPLPDSLQMTNTEETELAAAKRRTYWYINNALAYSIDEAGDPWQEKQLQADLRLILAALPPEPCDE